MMVDFFGLEFKKNADAAGPLGDLGITAPVLLPQYFRKKSHFLLKIKPNKRYENLN